jgi:hypothetical protein
VPDLPPVITGIPGVPPITVPNIPGFS